ncbi:MAG: YetF domain-containing protein, partial [Dehalococcoidia bacterium]
LRAARIAETDLWTQLRTAGVTAVDEVVAVVLETTGDMSVMQAPSGRRHEVDARLLAGVREQP